MKIASTKTMADLLNKEAKKMGVSDRHFRYITVPSDTYKMFIDMDIWEAEDNGDYLWQTGKLRAIEVEYPDEYCACNAYLTTKELNRIFKHNRGGIETAEDFAKIVIEEMEI